MAKTKKGPARDNWATNTKLVRGGLARTQFSETSEALFLTSGYVYESAEEAEQSFTGDKERYVYSRYANPTVAMFEERLALVEGAEFCQGMASGMAAVYAALASQLKTGDRVVASRALFGSCHYIVNDLLPKYGIHTELVDGTDPDQWQAALSQKTDAVFLETPSNPTLEIIDLKAVCDLAHHAGAKVVVDNVFATPILQRPMEYGADIVVYSATKHIDGQGRSLGGAVLTNDEAFFTDELTPFIRHTGPSLSPFNAWLMLKGLETLSLRMEKQCDNAKKVAEFLEGQSGLERVIFPELDSHPQHDLAMQQMDGRGGTVLSFVVPGDKETVFPVLNALELIDISNNLGDAKSLITHPATTTHQRLGEEERARMGISEGLVRLSVGLEDPADVCADLDQAFTAAGIQ